MTTAMSIFTDIVDQWQIADDAFAALESAAFAADDDQRFDAAGEQRKRNDQAYFLFIFTRFEDAVNQAAKIIVSNRTSAAAWPEGRIWEAWSTLVFREKKNLHFLSKAEVITDKSRHDYELIKEYYRGRNNIGHCGIYSEQFLIPQIAQFMDTISASFPTA
jgi:hypothetical protein